MKCAETELTLRLFGTPSVTGAGSERAVKLLARPKALALLTYLAIALPRGLRRRDEILALLWPDSDPGHGRNSLRQSLHLLRAGLPREALVSRGSDEIGLSEHGIQVDVRQFDDRLDSGRESEAMALYDGELVNGFRLIGNVEFDAWLTSERERLHRRAVRGALVLAKSHELDGDNARSSDWVRYALDRAPYDEDVLREAIALLLRIGDRAGAAAIYNGAVQRFRADLGISISPETARAGLSVTDNATAASAAAQFRSEGTIATIRPAAPQTPSGLLHPRVVSPEARRLCLEARQLAGQRSPVTIRRAIDVYEQVIKLAPDYAEAHAGLATALSQATVYVAYPGIDAWPRVRAHAARAIRLDPRLGESHATLAHVTLCYDYDWTRAGALFLQALELDPISISSRQLYALYYLTALGRTDEALAVFDRARDDFPDIAGGIGVYYGMSCVFGHEFERGLQEADFVLEGHPDLVQAYWVKGMAQEGMGDVAGAIETFKHGVELTGGSSLFLSQLGRACATAGERGRAVEILWELDSRVEDGGPGAYYAAEIQAALGNTDLALDRLYAAYRQRNPLMVFAGVLYGLDSLRGMRRFRDLLMRLGLPAYERDKHPAILPSQIRVG